MRVRRGPRPAEGLAGRWRSFRLPTLAALWEERVARAEQAHWGDPRLRQPLGASAEQDRRERKRQRRLKASGLPEGKTLGKRDEKLLPTPLRRRRPPLREGPFVERAENLLAFGLPGRGQTHFLAALGRAWIRRPRDPGLFTPTFKRGQPLLAAKQERRLESELKRLDRYRVGGRDDLGYVPQARAEREGWCTFLAERYERRSVLSSRNLGFSKGDPIFQDPMTTMAAIDRRVPHALIWEFNGESVRAQKAPGREKGAVAAPGLPNPNNPGEPMTR